MKYHYYVNDNDQPSGNHEVHRDGCSYLPLIRSKTYLGYFENCGLAVLKAQTIYPDSNGCAFCSPLCHTE